MGHDDYVAQSLKSIQQSLKKDFDSITSISKTHPKAAYIFLSSCMPMVINHYMQTVKPHLMADIIDWFKAAQRETLNVIADGKLNDLSWDLARNMPAGINQIDPSAPYVSSITIALPVLVEAYPELLAVLKHKLIADLALTGTLVDDIHETTSPANSLDAMDDGDCDDADTTSITSTSESMECADPQLTPEPSAALASHICNDSLVDETASDTADESTVSATMELGEQTQPTLFVAPPAHTSSYFYRLYNLQGGKHLHDEASRRSVVDQFPTYTPIEGDGDCLITLISHHLLTGNTKLGDTHPAENLATIFQILQDSVIAVERILQPASSTSMPHNPLINRMRQLHSIITSSADPHSLCVHLDNDQDAHKVMNECVRHHIAYNMYKLHATETTHINAQRQSGLADEQIFQQHTYTTHSLLLDDRGNTITIQQFLMRVLTDKEPIGYEIYFHIAAFFNFSFHIHHLQQSASDISTFGTLIRHDIPDTVRHLAPPLHVLFAHSHFSILHPPGEQPLHPDAPKPIIYLSALLASYDTDVSNPRRKTHSDFLKKVFASRDAVLDTASNALQPYFQHIAILQQLESSTTLLELLSLTPDGTTKLQSRLAAPAKQKALTDFKDKVTATNDAHLISHVMSTLEREATLYLTSLAKSDESPTAFSRTLCRTLHLIPNSSASFDGIGCICTSSKCGAKCDALSGHQYNCKQFKDQKKSTHNAVAMIVVQALQAAQVAVSYETKNFLFDEVTGKDRRPDFTVLGHLNDDRFPPNTYGDVMITTTHPKEFTIKQAKTPHDRCLYGVKFKHDKYATVTNSNMLVPIVIDSAGHIAPSSMQFLNAIFHKISTNNQIPFSKTQSYWLKMISCAVHKGITADIINVEKSSRLHNLALQGLNSNAKHDCVDAIFILEHDSVSDSNPQHENALRE